MKMSIKDRKYNETIKMCSFYIIIGQAGQPDGSLYAGAPKHLDAGMLLPIYSF
jgi:hypothetical protein